MKVLVVNGSPKGDKGNTEILIQSFLAGAHEAGAESEVVYLKDRKIEHCVGCFSCWIKTPGVCIHKDDMVDLLPKLVEADVLVCASPLYIYTVSGMMKDFMDRIIPIVQPFIEVKDGVSTHPGRQGESDSKQVVLISNSGFPEQIHFSGLRETMRCWFRASTRTLSGMICCPSGGMLQRPEYKDNVAWYLDAVRQAGREVVEQKGITQPTQSILDRPLVEDNELFANMANAMWRSMGLKPI